MPRNGAGTFNLVNNTWFPAVNGVLATSTDWGTFISDVASALTQSVSSDGQTQMTGSLPMGNNKITGLAPGTANTDAAQFAQTTGRLLGTQIFTATGVYTPTAGTTKIIIDLVGGGGGGGGVVATGAGQCCASAGGGGAGYVRSLITAGFSGQTVTIGAAGAGAAAGGSGGSGGNSTFMTCSASGGSGGAAATAGSVSTAQNALGGGASGGTIWNLTGGRGYNAAYGSFAAGLIAGGSGGTSFFGVGGTPVVANTGNTVIGLSGNGFGAGASGTASGASQGINTGSPGTIGIAVIYEFA